MKHVVMFSGGVGSWAAAKRVAKSHGTAGMVLLFADTLSEDADTYRWLEEAAANIGVPLTRLTDGRDIWQVFEDRRFLGNNRVDPCSEDLKRKPSRVWVEANCAQSDTVLYLGYDWTEQNRITRTQRAWAGWRVEAPMSESPYLFKAQMLAWAEAEGIKQQRLYTLGMPHANCSGGCVKAGIGHWLHLLRVWPERYAEWEANEQRIRLHLDKDVAMLRDRTGDETTPLTLRELRERQEARPEQYALFADDYGGCGCFTESEVPE